jgi:hypothetical protein
LSPFIPFILCCEKSPRNLVNRFAKQIGQGDALPHSQRLFAVKNFRKIGLRHADIGGNLPLRHAMGVKVSFDRHVRNMVFLSAVRNTYCLMRLARLSRGDGRMGRMA